MRKSRKKLIASVVACVLAGTMAFNGTMAYLTDTEGTTNIATVGKVRIDLEEPGYPGNDSNEVAAIIPNQEITKDPLIENTGDNAALVYLRVEVPQETFTELGSDGTKGETQLQDLFKLKGLSDNWELIRTEVIKDAEGKTKTSYVYAYKQPLDAGTKTDKLFEKVQMRNAIENDLSGHVEDIIITACAIQATDIPDVDVTPGEDGTLGKSTLDTVYDIFLKQSGDISPRPADEGNKTQNGKLGKILYELDGGEISGELTSYDAENYGYVPPTPVKKDFKFIGWVPEQLPNNSTGSVTFTAQWEENSADLLSGQEISVKMRKLAGNSSATYSSTDTAITAIQRSNEAPSDAVIEDANSLISTNDSGNPVYAWFEDGTIKWWSEAEHINAGSDLSYLCAAMTNLTDISGFSDWNTSNTGNMSYVFAMCKSLVDLKPLADWDTGKVTNMFFMFDDCSQLTDLTGLANWQTDKVTNMSYMFYRCSNLANLNGLASWQTDNVTNMDSMFYGCSQLTNLAGLTNWDTSEVTNMNSMFGNCSSLTDLTGLANWNTGSATQIGAMFDGCSSLTDLTGLANWRTGGVTLMARMFAGCSSLTDLTGLANWQTGNVTNMYSMFNGCRQLANLTGLATWQIDKVTSMESMFAYCSNLTDLTELANWNTDNVTNMGYMFRGCSQLSDLAPLTNWNTNNVTDMKDMFYECTNLNDLTPLAKWNVSKVTNMQYMFYNCRNLTNISAVNDWDIANVTTFYQIFRNCPSHPTFTKRAGTWDSEGTFTPTT